MTDLSRDIGRIEARQDSADERLDRIEAKLDQLLEAWAQNKGGIRVLVAVGSIAAALATAIMESIHYLRVPRR